MPKYVFRYFDGKGRGEIIRLLFVLKGVDFEDKRFTQETWPAEKPNTPYGQMPVLSVDGKDYTESLAIARFLAREFDLYGANNQQSYCIDQAIGMCQDLFTEYVKAFFAPEDKKPELEKALKETVIPKHLGNLNKALSDSGYCAGEKLSLGDLAVFDLVDGHVDDETLAKFANVKAIAGNVRANDNIKKYLSSRKQTPI